jgi:hypothetical protein
LVFLIGSVTSKLTAHITDRRSSGIRTTCQFNTKIFYIDGSKPHLWCSSPLENYGFTDDKTGFFADDCALELSEDGTAYTIKSINDERAIVNLTIRRTAPGFQAGRTGNTLFGTDLTNPWGSMRHAFWPRCTAEGTITTAEGPIDFKGKAFYSHALQGMKPHHAAARWNFVNFQGPTHSAILMEYTTPPSYGSTVVNVGGIAKDGEIIMAGCGNSATHVKSKADTENGWPEPTLVKFTWSGTTSDGRAVQATIEGDLEERMDKVDVMAEVPGFVKKIITGAVGTKPYIYQVNSHSLILISPFYHGIVTDFSTPHQYSPRKQKASLKLTIGDQEIVEEGELFSEATFITE